MGQKSIDLAETTIHFYPTENGGRRVPLRFRWFSYTLHFKFTKNSRDYLGVHIIDGPSEIHPGSDVTVIVAFTYFSSPKFPHLVTDPQVFPVDELIEGRDFYHCLRFVALWGIPCIPLYLVVWRNRSNEVKWVLPSNKVTEESPTNEFHKL